ncbi:3-carboxy-cis,cis-mucoante lactonizing enzyme [Ceraceosorus guamensis]|uniref:3-carboxy-cis,cis-mucoante lactonizing enzyme n=1 Tax=Ceraceosorus guamensis TaxID=1522189 RepID=A0A316W3I0_9BASI|nr:3-carboxy-cis,cis-mucoante lactonizing enzyme [Ceraceosorus guamensis]PWN44074.1 3-carboxy-cis,cis-mucoante lactonizing enzyme [Ceraceosorus guamensis]
MRPTTIAALALLSACSLLRGVMSAQQNGQLTTQYALYTSSYSGDVKSFTFRPPAGITQNGNVGNETTGGKPSWLTFGGKLEQSHIIYATNEATPGEVNVLTSGADGQLTALGGITRTSTGGNGPVASDLVKDQLFVANYDSGSAAVLPLSPDRAALFPAKVFNFTRSGTGPVTKRQNAPYAHDAVADPDGKFVYVPDLGSDVIRTIKVGERADMAELLAETPVEPGSGPRHLKFVEDAKYYTHGHGASANGQFRRHSHDVKHVAYLTSEFANTVTAFTQDPQTGKLSQIGARIPSVPPGTQLGGDAENGPARTLAEVQTSVDGALIYVSNRGDSTEDHISVLRRLPNDSLEWLAWYPSGGRNTRHFSISPDGRYLATANQASGTLAILKIDGEHLSIVAKLEDQDQINFAGFAPW